MKWHMNEVCSKILHCVYIIIISPVRVYMEKYEADPSKVHSTPAAALEDIIAYGLKVSDLQSITGMTAPTVIT